MDVLILGGTRFMGPHLIRALLRQGHSVTVATRGSAADPFGAQISRIVTDRYDPAALKRAVPRPFDVVYDTLAYASADVRTALGALECGRYIMVSSASAYDSLANLVTESAFDPLAHPLRWGSRNDFSYAEGKRQAEAALFQCYPAQNAAAVRFPFVIGPDDYTERFRFYLSHIWAQAPMNVDNPDAQMSLISSAEAGSFLAGLAASSLAGPVNACSDGTVSLRQVFSYVEERCGRSPLLSPDGDAAPYNGTGDYCLDTGKARRHGFSFSPVTQWIFPLVSQIAAELSAQSRP